MNDKNFCYKSDVIKGIAEEYITYKKYMLNISRKISREGVTRESCVLMKDNMNNKKSICPWWSNKHDLLKGATQKDVRVQTMRTYTKNLSQNTWLTNRVSNHVPYKYRALLLHQLPIRTQLADPSSLIVFLSPAT